MWPSSLSLRAAYLAKFRMEPFVQQLTADPTITEAIAKPASKGGVVGAARFVVDRLKSAGLISEMVLPPMSLGIHPTNRGKYGVNEETVHLLGGVFAGNTEHRNNK